MNNDTKEKNGSGFSSQGKKPTIWQVLQGKTYSPLFTFPSGGTPHSLTSLWRKEVLLGWWVSATGVFTLHPLVGRTIQWETCNYWRFAFLLLPQFS